MSSTIIAAIRQGLVQNTAVTTLVPESRITSAYRQDTGTLPAIVLTVQTDEAVSPSFPRTDCLRRMAMNIECIATSLKAARELGEIVRRAMHGAAGTASSTTIHEIRENGITSTYDVGAEGTETGIHIAVVSVDAYYRAQSVSPTTITTPGG